MNLKKGNNDDAENEATNTEEVMVNPKVLLNNAAWRRRRSRTIAMEFFFLQRIFAERQT